MDIAKTGRRRFALVAGSAVALILAGCTATGSPNPAASGPAITDLSKHEGKVVVGGPGGAWGAAVEGALKDFGQANGIEITYQQGTTSENLARLQAQRQGGRVEFDLIMTNDRTHSLAGAQGLFQNPNFSLLKNVGDLDRKWTFPPAVFGEPPNGLRHVVISEGLGYNTKIFTANGWDPPTSLEDLYNPKFASCAIPVNPSSGLSYLPVLNRINSGNHSDFSGTLKKFQAVARQVPTEPGARPPGTS